MISGRHGHSNSGLPAAFGPLAGVGALIGTILFGGELFPLIEGPIWSRLTAQYSYEAASTLIWLVWLLSYPAVFFVLRAGLLAAALAVTAFTTNRLL